MTGNCFLMKIGPIINTISGWVAGGLVSLYDLSPVLAGILIGGSMDFNGYVWASLGIYTNFFNKY